MVDEKEVDELMKRWEGTEKKSRSSFNAEIRLRKSVFDVRNMNNFYWPYSRHQISHKNDFRNKDSDVQNMDNDVRNMDNDVWTVKTGHIPDIFHIPDIV